MRRVFEDGIEIALCPKCEGEFVKSKDDNWVCEDCGEVIL